MLVNLRTKRKQRTFAILMVMTMLFSMFYYASPTITMAESTETNVVEMKFEENPFGDGKGNLSTNPITSCNTGEQIATLSASSKDEVTYTGSNKTIWTYGWEKGGYWQLDFSSIGYTNLSFSADMYSTNSGPRDFQIHYSTNGSDYVPVEGTEVALGGSHVKGSPYNRVALPKEVENAEYLSIRLVITSHFNRNGTTLSPNNGANSRIANIVITGTKMFTEPEKETLAGVNIEPLGGEITADTQITITYLGKDVDISTGSALVASGSAITLNYRINDGGWNEYANPLIAGEIAEPGKNFTISAYASAEGYKSGAISQVTYKIPSSEEEPVVHDPITEDMIPSGVATIKDIYAMPKATGTATVIGQLTYVFGNYNTMNSAILQDVIDGEIIGLQIYNALDQFKIGDIITVTGTVTEYGGVRQLQNITASERLREGVKLIDPQEVSITELKNNNEEYLSEYVVIKGVTLGTYSSTGSTTITDDKGISFPMYRAATYPDNITAGEIVDVYGISSKYGTTYQLRVGSSTSYKKVGSIEVDTSVVLPMFSVAGTKAPTLATVYGDLFEENDGLDNNTELTLSTGAVPVSGDMQFIGSKGLTKDQYYQIKTKAYGYGNMNLSFQMRGSKTGAKNFQLLYSTDGVNYLPGGSSTIQCSYTQYGQDGVGTPVNYEAQCTNGKFSLITDGKFHNVSLTLPEKANHSEVLYLRVMVTDSISIGNGTIGSGGTNYITSIAFTGSPVVHDSICSMVTIEPKSGNIKLGEELTMSTKTEESVIYYSLDGVNFNIYDKKHKPILNTLPANITVYAAKDGLANSIKTSYKYTQAQVATVKGSPNGGAVNQNALLKLTCETIDAEILYSFDEGKTWDVYKQEIKLETLPVNVTTYAMKEGYLDSEIKTLSFIKRENEEYNLYYGQLHSHTSYSDGAGTCDDAFLYASTKAEQIDFLAVTDHSNSFDNDTKATIKDGSVSSEWVEGHKLAKQYTSETFVGIYGYEMTWSGGAPGHMNTFNTEGFLSRNMNGFGNGSTASLPNYYAQLKTVPDSISQFNHPGSTFGDFYDFGYYDEEIDELVTMIEVGNGEGAIGSSGYFPSYEYYTRALDKGWHVAPTNNQDNHKGKWGDANTGRTVILADTLTEESIYDALRNMRVYATEDNNIKVWYTLNGADMGTIMEEQPDKVEILVKAEEEDKTEGIGKVEIIVNGGLSIASKNLDSNQGEATFTLEPNYSYYYVRITQKDGDIIVTAPVWISEVEAVGISSISTSATLAVKGEPIDISTTLYNNEADTLHIKSMTYTIDNEVIYEVDLNTEGVTKVEPLKEAAHSFTYTYNGLGKTDIYVTVVAEYNGVQKVFKEVLQLNFVAPNMVTRVIVDGTHNNDYVTGYYGGNVGNFADIAAKDNVQVNVVTDKITSEMLKDCSLLIISAPAKKTGTYQGKPYEISHFEDEFIKLVADYVASGGNLIVCGLADYQDSTSGQSSTELNKLLSAIGATTRINSDQLVDDERNGGQNYRLYFTNFNRDSIYLKGVSEVQEYSAYSGAGVLLDSDAVAGGKVEALVYGHASTYSNNTKNFDDNFVETPKGTVIALAHETLESGSNIFVAGTVFISDFEVKSDLDNAGDSYYANRNILLNILAENKVRLETTPIKEVRQAALGEIFAIEGYVTAGTAVEGNIFFDTIYVEDETAGITVFPVADAGIPVGQKVRIVGFVDSYQGDKEIQVISYELLNNIKVTSPTLVTTKEAVDYERNGGKLLKINGVVTKVDIAGDDVKYIYVKDASGVIAKVFIDGYITSSTGVDMVKNIAKVGNTISAVGLSYMNPEGVCLRVRDRAEIILVKEGTNTGSKPSEKDDGSSSDTNTKTAVTKDLASGATLTTTITKGTDGKEIKASASVIAGIKVNTSKEGTVKVQYQLPVDLILQFEKDTNTVVQLAITVPDNEILQRLKETGAKQLEINIAIPRTISQNNNILVERVIIRKEVFIAAKDNKVDIVAKIVREKEVLASEWYILANKIAKLNKDISDVNLVATVSWRTGNRLSEKLTKLDKALTRGVILDTAYEGNLPFDASIKLYVGPRNGIRMNSKVYIYQLSNDGAELKQFSKTEYYIDKKGYLTLELERGGAYIILPKEATKKVIGR